LFIAIPFAKIYCVEVFSEDRKTPLGVSYRKKFPKLQAVFAPKKQADFGILCRRASAAAGYAGESRQPRP
jgi:hypothetical protein